MSVMSARMDHEERETTVILLPGDEAAVDGHRNLVIEIGGSA
jgi:hypothetical protein